MPAKTTRSAPPSPERLMQMAWGYSTPLMIEAAVATGLFDRLADAPKDAAALAAATKTSERGVRALANALVGLGLLQRDGDAYTLTPESATFLVSSSPAYHGAFFRHTSSQILPHWMKLTDSVRTGRPARAANDEAQGAAFFHEFVEAIFPMSYAAARTAAAALKVSRTRTPWPVLDVAAGSGVWGIAFAQASPQVTVTAVDWKTVLPVTRRVAKRHGVADRFRFVAGDIATARFGTGHRTATLGHILHSEGEERSRVLLRRVFDALAPGGTVVIAEFVPDDDRRGPPMPLIFAVNMLLHTERGDAFTFAEIASWLAEAGFADVRRLEAPAPSPLILATKP